MPSPSDAAAIGAEGSADARTARIRWGILGTGRVTRHVLAALADVEAAELVAIASRDVKRARAFAERTGLASVAAYGSYEKLLADPWVDAVYIALPNALHLPWSLRALEAGKHVLCEKPLGADADEVAALFDAAKVHRRVMVEGLMYRHHPQTARLLELVRGGAIGDVQLVQSSFSFPLHDAGNVRLSQALEGGALMDIGCYCVDTCRLLLGEPLALHAETVTGLGGVDVRTVATLRFADDRVAQLDVALTLPRRTHLEVRGDGGTLVLEDPWHCRMPGIELRREGGAVEWFEIERVSPFRCELEHVGRAIAGEVDPQSAAADAIAQARALGALRRASR